MAAGWTGMAAIPTAVPAFTTAIARRRQQDKHIRSLPAIRGARWVRRPRALVLSPIAPKRGPRALRRYAGAIRAMGHTWIATTTASDASLTVVDADPSA